MIRSLCVFALILSSLCAAASQPVERIVALSPSSTEMLFEMGVGTRVVGTVEWADFPEAAKAIPRIGSYAGINIEALVALRPDLVVAWKSGNKEADLQKLEALGLNLIYVDPKTMDSVAGSMEELGAAAGVPEAGKAAAQRFRERYQALKGKYADANPVRVFYQLSYDPLRTVGKGSWVDALINDCGGNNVFGKASAHYPVVAFESVIARDPEVIIMSSHTNVVNSKEALWSEWPSVAAVKSGHLVPVNSSALLRSGPRATEGLALLCSAIDQAR